MAPTEGRPQVPLGGPSSALPATDGPTFASSLGAPVLAPRADEPSAAAAAGPTQLLGGLLGGLVAAILASAVWFGVVAVSGYQVGLVAIAVGFLVGQAWCSGRGGTARSFSSCSPRS